MLFDDTLITFNFTLHTICCEDYTAEMFFERTHVHHMLRTNLVCDIHIHIYYQIEFVDIAGIVKGASEGAGLGNKFLMNIRMTDAIVHVVRCFVDDDIIHVDGNVDPLRDVEVISLELILADLSQIEKRLERVRIY